MKISQDKTEGKDIFTIQTGVFKKTGLAEQLKSAFREQEDFKNKNIELDLAEGKQKFRLNGRIIKKKEDYPYRLLLRFEK
jgi:hypothetical protein